MFTLLCPDDLKHILHKYYTALFLLETSVYFVIQRGIHTILDHSIHKTKNVTFF